MSEKKIIAIIGATGAQGGGLVRAILSDPNSEFSVRAITRKPDTEKALALQKLGAEIVKADLDDMESLVKAFTGAYGAFCITNFWEHLSPEKEYEQAKNMAHAAKKATVKHVIWSSLDDTRKLIPMHDNSIPTLMGKYKVPHFDAKGEADKFFLEGNLPATILYTAFYWENMIYFGQGPTRGEDGKLTLNLPMGDKKLPSIASEDIGKCAYGIFKAGQEYIGKTVGIAGDQVTGNDIARALTNELGEEVVYNAIPAEVYRGFGFPGAEDMGNMYQFKRDYNDYYTKSRDTGIARKLNPSLLTFNDWVKKNKDRIPV